MIILFVFSQNYAVIHAYKYSLKTFDIFQELFQKRTEILSDNKDGKKKIFYLLKYEQCYIKKILF